MSSSADTQIIPDVIIDTNSKVSYTKGRYFGKGGFAKCYEITDNQTKQVYAGKMVSKKLMMKHNQKDKMTQEITIHRSLNHKHVVGFHGFFEDIHNVYIILELCRRRSMMELHKRRKTLTEPETRFYLHQILDGVNYLHTKRIIHRDLKLGNIFLNDELNVKIGDFGLATRVEFNGERKKTLCGTPNYIAPEILNKKGHSFEVDVWSIGCIMYTLLMGKPPFETGTLRETYSKIKKCDYRIPKDLSTPAVNMIVKMLQTDPQRRPTVADLLNHEFFTHGYMPSCLPASCLTMAPRFDHIEAQHKQALARRPLGEMNNAEHQMIVDSPRKPMQNNSITSNGRPIESSEDYQKNLRALKEQLTKLLLTKPGREHGNFGDDMTDPAAQPVVWVSKWVDYSDKYGFGYQLCDEGVGVMYNDTTKLIMLANGLNVHYIGKDGVEHYMTVDDYPAYLEKKMKLLSYFHRYMREHLMKAGAQIKVKESDSLSRIPHLHQWCRTGSAVVMHLTNGTVQVNFLDHTKIIMCPLMSAVTYIDNEKNFRTYRFQTIEEHGCSIDLARNLRYALEKINNLLSK
ncbi:serine/threonine-protein kinase polo isoform X1 [Chrysoperla carnea]|uniref:serine/threonine-protein kinase polo isoform X1 n=1 Tax=Chrysoperla carnea TaxID=189513 RepID=UPI001D06A8CF|nr:serine/threonine-protein kinase polo isoform X1 [Chrysoperla carnea]